MIVVVNRMDVKLYLTKGQNEKMRIKLRARHVQFIDMLLFKRKRSNILTLLLYVSYSFLTYNLVDIKP